MAGVFFPVRAREALRKATAQLLEQLGDFAFDTLGEFCQARFCWERLPSSAYYEECRSMLGGAQHTVHVRLAHHGAVVLCSSSLLQGCQAHSPR